MEEEWAWLAGIIDGEGSLGFSRNKCKSGVTYWYYLNIGNTNEKIVRKIITILEKNSISFSLVLKKDFNKNLLSKKPFYVVYIGKKKSIKEVLEKTIPYLTKYQEKAQVYFDLLEKRVNKCSDNKFTEEEIELRNKVINYSFKGEERIENIRSIKSAFKD